MWKSIAIFAPWWAVAVASTQVDWFPLFLLAILVLISNLLIVQVR